MTIGETHSSEELRGVGEIDAQQSPEIARSLAHENDSDRHAQQGRGRPRIPKVPEGTLFGY